MLLFVPLVLMFLFYVVNFYKKQNDTMIVLDIFGAAFSISVRSKPKQPYEKIILLLAFFIYINYSVEFIASLTEAIVFHDELSFESLEDTDKSNFKVMINQVVST